MKLLMIGLVALSSSFAQASLQGRVERATEVIDARMGSSEPIPDYVIRESHCIAALRVVKVGFIFGGQGSGGMVSCRTPQGWSAPSFYTVSGVNFGIQIAVQFLETVLSVVTDYGKEVIETATFQLGTDLSFAAGPIGQGSGSGVIPAAHVLSYQKAKGLYVGATINGFVLAHDRAANRRAFGEELSPSKILSIPGRMAPSVLHPYVEALSTYFGE